MVRVRQAVEANRFAKLSSRELGVENKTDHIRKGVVGDWRNHFTRADARAFNAYAGEELVLAGYEEDRSWPDRMED